MDELKTTFKRYQNLTMSNEAAADCIERFNDAVKLHRKQKRVSKINKLTRWCRHLFVAPTPKKPREKRKIIMSIEAATAKPTVKAYVTLTTVWQNTLSAEERVSIGQDVCISFLGVEKGQRVFNHLVGEFK
jgi:hypothetical protein